MTRSQTSPIKPLDAPGPGEGWRTTRGIKLTLKEVRHIVEIWSLPPFVALEQAASIANLTPGSLRSMVSEGRFPNSAVKGKPLMFVTTKFIQEVARRAGGSR